MDLKGSNDTTKYHAVTGALRRHRNKNGTNKRHHKPCKQTNKRQKLCAGSGSLKPDHLANDQLITNTLNKQKIREDNNEIILSEGAHDSNLEVGYINATEGANAPSLKKDTSKDPMRIIMKHQSTKKKFKSSLDVISKTKPTHNNQGLTTSVRTQAKVRSVLVALHKLAKNIHQDVDRKMGQTTEKFLAHHASINMLDGECNDTHPLAFMAGGQVNPNILSHGEAMAAFDKEQFQTSMDEEMGKCFDNGIYEIVKRSSVPDLKSILRAVWSHRRKNNT